MALFVDDVMAPPIDRVLFEKGLADARAGLRRNANALDLAPPDYAAGFIAGSPVAGSAAADLPGFNPILLTELLYAAAMKCGLPLPVACVTRAAVALLGPEAEAQARRRARLLFDRELLQEELGEASDDRAAA